MMSCLLRSSRAAQLALMLAFAILCAVAAGAVAAKPACADENARAPASFSTVAGETQFDTAVAQSKAAFSSSKWAIVVGSKGWSDALAASGLAGALDCPILYTDAKSLTGVTAKELSRLGVENVLVLGGTAAVSDGAFAQLGKSYSVQRLGGTSLYDTQMAIYEYGMANNLWAKDTLFVATGRSFADALSVAPVAYKQKAPIFLIDSSSDFTDAQRASLLAGARLGYFKRTVIIGGTVVVDSKAEGFATFISALSSGSGNSCVRLAGQSAYDTNASVASWAVGNAGMTWDKVAIASGVVPYDALAGAPLQAKRGSVIILVGSAPSVSVDALAKHSSSVKSVTYFGGTGIIKPAMRTYVDYSLRFGYALPSGGTKMSNNSYLWVDSSGIYRNDAEYYKSWIAIANRYSSPTDYLMIVDTGSNHTVIFKGYKGAWGVDKFWRCSTGAWNSPTVKGLYTIQERGLSFGHGYTCWYWTQFYGDYLFHSGTYYPGSMTKVMDDRMGVNISAGCVRLPLERAKWIYDNIPRHTTVYIFGTV